MSRRLSIAAIVAMLAMAGCDPPDGDSSAEVKIQIYTWWTKGGEKPALDALEEVNRKKHPNVSLNVNLTQNAEDAFRQLDTVLYYDKTPLDTFQANGGSKLLSRVVFEREGWTNLLKSPSQLKPLTELYDKQAEAKIWDFLPPLIEYQNTRYGVPLNLHRINNLYFNIRKMKRLREIAADQPTDITELALPTDAIGFVDLAQEARGMLGGPSVGIGWSDSYTLETLVFENLMPSVAISVPNVVADPASFPMSERREFFHDFWSGNRPPTEKTTHAVIDRTLLLAQRLWPCVKHYGAFNDPKSNDGKWDAPFKDFLDDTQPLTFVVMGDWATGYLQSYVKNEDSQEKAILGVDFDVVPFPGTESLFLYTTDTLPLVDGANHPVETLDFLATALSPEGQVAFNRIKGSIPALVGLSPRMRDKLNERQNALILMLEEKSDTELTKSAAISGLLTPDIEETYFREVLKNALVSDDEVNGRDMMHHAFENNYWLLKLWTKTLARTEGTP